MRGATFTLPVSGDRPDDGLGLDRSFERQLNSMSCHNVI